MTDPIISIVNLGKKYRLDHRPGRQRYTALRDVIAEKAKYLFRFQSARLANRAATPSLTEDFWALKDVSFEITQGEVVGIIGRNGAGKSTLLKILSQITEPTTGRVRIRGRVASLLEVGTGFHPELTGRENIYLNGIILGMTRVEIRRKFDEIVAFAEVEKFLDTPVKRYSSGMQVRLAFAVAAHLEPEILVVDEVLAVGDAEFQKKCFGKMENVAKQHGRTVLFVSHNMGAVQALCGSGVLLDRGQLRRIGSMDSVISAYLDSLRKIGSTNGTASIDLGPTLQLGRLECRPMPIRSGDPISLEVQFIPKMPTVIKDLQLLFYSESGVRVAALDLRQGLCNQMIRDSPLDFEVCIASLPLVEGDYRLGFWIGTQNHYAYCPDIASITVGAPQRHGDLVPYPAQHRGFVEMEFTVQKEVKQEATSMVGIRQRA
jgi:lipopolysaccharide transport system ATP-binding protein